MTHKVSFMMYETGDIGSTMTCSDDQAPCHYMCQENCEEWDFVKDHRHGPIHYLSDHGEEFHRLVYYPHQCNAIEWFNSGPPGDTYAGPDHPLEGGEVMVRYDRGYESMVWRYADDGQKWGY